MLDAGSSTCSSSLARATTHEVDSLFVCVLCVFIIIKSISTRDRYLEYLLDHVTEPVPEFVAGMIF
jgi:hypothetical protein